MPVDVTHFSMVGFAYEAADPRAGLNSLVRRFQSTCRPAPISAQEVDCIAADPSGAELHIGLKVGEKGAELMTLNPAFAGEGRVAIEVQGDNTDPEWRPFEISVAARFAGQETPLVFDLANPREAQAFKPGAKLTVDIAAFSYGPDVYEDEAAFYAAQKASKAPMASNFFMPSGMFFEKVGGAMENDAKRPTAYADFAGKVIKTAVRANAAGGHDYRWALVETYEGATIDLVIDPQSLKREPKPGSIIAGRYWLSARIVPGT